MLVSNTLADSASSHSVSVAIATYNGEGYLRQQLDSIAAQTLLPGEVVITDDSPTEGTRRIAEQFAATVTFPVRIYANPERLGYVNNFLRAASLCTGQWIAFCDQDDVWMPHKLESCLSTLHEHKAILAIHASEVVDSDLNPAEGREPVIERSEVLEPLKGDPWWCPPGFAMIFAADLLRRFDASERPKSHISPDQLPHDHWVFFLARATGKIALIDVPLAKYRRHSGNVTSDLPPSGIQWAKSASANTGAEHYRGMAALATSYAAFWQNQEKKLCQNSDTEIVAFGPHTLPRTTLQGQYTTAVHFYAGIADRFMDRALLYDSSIGSFKRLAALSGQLTAGNYVSRRRGGLGVRSLAKDLLTVACSVVTPRTKAAKQ